MQPRHPSETVIDSFPPRSPQRPLDRQAWRRVLPLLIGSLVGVNAAALSPTRLSAWQPSDAPAAELQGEATPDAAPAAGSTEAAGNSDPAANDPSPESAPESTEFRQPPETAQPPETRADRGDERSEPGAEGTGKSGEEVDPEAGGSDADAAGREPNVVRPLVTLVIGIAVVLGLIIVLRVNAFIALISAAMIVSLMAPGDIATKISRVATAFGNTAGGIGIVIALAAVIGKCMLDSGAADRIVRAFVRLLGEKQAPVALMGSGYVLAIPVFFDTVFYLLVPLARSLHRQTGKQYLKYILAIGAGGAITHSLVPPTPGPLLMASTLGIDLGLMIMIGAAVALPAAAAGVLFADVADRIMKTPMRSLGSEPEPEPLADEQLPPLALAILPVLLPVLLISTNTILTTVADLEPTARLTVEQVRDWPELQARMQAAAMGEGTPAVQRLWDRLPEESRRLLGTGSELDASQRQEVVAGFNRVLGQKDLYEEQAFLGVPLAEETKDLLGQDRTRMRRAVLERMNRLLLEDSLNSLSAPAASRDVAAGAGEAGDTALIEPHTWRTPWRVAADVSDVFGNANLALLLSTIIALFMLAYQRGLTLNEVARVVETSLMSGGVIILITAGGGAFGAMLQAAQIGDAIQSVFGSVLGSGGDGLAFLFLGFLLAGVLKIAQGSGTVAMIVGSSMMAAIVGPGELSYNPAYLATAIGAGSLVGSWMNDSGFWIFAKMGGLTETEALKSWTLMLVFLGLIAFAVTLLLAVVLPLPVVGG